MAHPKQVTSKKPAPKKEKPKERQEEKKKIIPADRYFNAREILHVKLINICGAACPGHETRMTDSMMRAIDELIDAGISMRFEREFGADKTQEPFNPNE